MLSLTDQINNPEEVFQPLMEALLDCVTPAEVAAVVVERGTMVLRAQAGLVALVTEDGTALEVIRASGYPEKFMSGWERFPLAANLPLSDAVRGNAILLFSGRADWETHYPGMIRTRPLGDFLASASLPLAARGRVFGGIHFTFPTERNFGVLDHSFLSELVYQCALALDRAILLEKAVAARKEAEAVQQRFRALADNITQLVWMADTSGTIFWYNQRWFDYTGTTLPQMGNEGWKCVHHPEYADRVDQKFREHFQSEQPWEDTFPLRGSNGGYRWFLSRTVPIRDEFGIIVRWCGTHTDITEQRAAEIARQQGEERVKALYETTSRTDLSFEEKVDHLLTAGREWLSMDIGVLAHTDCDKGIYEIIRIVAAEPSFQSGMTLPLQSTLCAEIVRRNRSATPFFLESIGQTPPWREHVAHQQFGREAYIAAPIWTTSDAPWGTISFSSSTPRSEPFSDFDKDLVQLIAQWVGSEIARQEAADALRTSAEKQRRFVREMLASVTEGKLCLCETVADLPNPLPLVSEVIALQSATLRVLRSEVSTATNRMDIPLERSHDLITAASEAGMNAVRHAGGGVATVHADEGTGVVQVWIRDQGTGIREEDLHRATLEKGWSGAGTLGHGFFLMLRTADRTFLCTSPEGTTVVLEQGRTPPKPAWLAALDQPLNFPNM